MADDKKELSKLEKNYEISSVTQAADMASLLKGHIVKEKLYTKIGDKNYAHVDGWAYAGGLMGVIPRVVKVENLSSGTEKKWRADVELVRIKDGTVMGYGTALCSSAESRKRSFDEYAILSMAQTRAIGKAFRNTIGWVMKLAGYEGTPKEEMTKIGDELVPQVSVGVDEVGIQEETQDIQALLRELGYASPARQLTFIKKFCEKKGYQFDGWKMSKKVARELLAGLLQMKLQKNG